MTTVEKLKAYIHWDQGLDPYAYLDADDARRIRTLLQLARYFCAPVDPRVASTQRAKLIQAIRAMEEE